MTPTRGWAERERPEYVRRWRQGDPREVRGRMLFRDAVGDVWLSPAEVRTLGLTDLIRDAEGPDAAAAEQERITAVVETGIEARLQEAGTDDVRPAGEEDGGAVPADEWIEEDPEPGQSGTPEPPTGTAEAVGLALQGGGEFVIEAAARAGVLEPPPSGETPSGRRWWIVRDPAGDRLAWDNRPAYAAHGRWMEEAYGEGGTMRPEYREGGPRHMPIVHLEQGSVPMDVVRAAAEHARRSEAALRYVTELAEAARQDERKA
jgi:hypothetical protein